MNNTFSKSVKITTIITSLSELEDWKPKFTTTDIVAFDTETMGLDRFTQAVGISLAVNENEAIYIPFKIWNGTELVNPWISEAYEEVIAFIKDILSSKKLIAHNAVFDCKVIKNTLGIEIIDNIHCDTAVLHHTVIDENPPHGLKDLATQYLTEEASTPQEDLKLSIIENGGKWNATEKEFYKGSYELLGKYACYDVLYTYGLYNLWYPLIEKESLQDLWYKEAHPLIKVTYDLNTTGLSIDVDYFNNLKADMKRNIENIEAIIFSEIADKVEDYEYQIALKKSKISNRSELGKLLPLEDIKADKDTVFDEEGNILSISKRYKETVMAWYKKKKEIKRVFNLDSNVDKAFLLYDVLGFECTTTTATGKRSASKADFERILAENEDNEVVSLLSKRQKEIKLLSTYVESILEKHIDGRIYPEFNQIGTVSGRYSSNNPNFQTLPRDDLRIKKGIKPDDGYVIVNCDFSALEPRCFAVMADSPGIKDVYLKGLDLYSKIAIDVFGLEDVSANPSDENYLGKVNKAKRQLSKIFTLSVPYGVGSFRLAEQMKCTTDEAKELIGDYLNTYPQLKKYMKESERMGMQKGYVTNIVGRRKRFQYINTLYNKYNMHNISVENVKILYKTLPHLKHKFESDKHLYRLAKNELNLCKNFRIQSLAASIANASTIKIRQALIDNKIDGKVCMQVHDEITLMVRKEHADKAAELLKDAMENNWVAKLLDVPMVADPIIAENLSEAK